MIFGEYTFAAGREGYATRPDTPPHPVCAGRL